MCRTLEFVGIVDEARPADAAWIGRRVIGEIAAALTLFADH